MQLDLTWARLELLPSSPYSVSTKSSLPTLGLAFARQRGVHAIASDHRLDFDAWPGDLAYTSPEVPVFSESPHGGEYLLLHIKSPELLRSTPTSLPRQIMHGDKVAVKLAQALRRTLILHMAGQAIQTDALLVEEQAMAWLQHGLTLLQNRPTLSATSGRYQLERHVHAQILEYIDDHIDYPITLDDLAKLSRMPLLRFLRSFSNAIGMTPHTYITERRLQRARQLLRYSEAPIAEIALDCGFTHQSHLGSALRAKLGMSPQQYRQARQGIK